MTVDLDAKLQTFKIDLSSGRFGQVSVKYDIFKNKLGNYNL